MATTNKSFKVKNGLIVEGTTGTINGYDILTKNSADQNYIIGLIGGSATSDATPNTVVLRDENGSFSAVEITADVIGTVSDISNHDTNDLSEGSTNKYFTDQRAVDANTGLWDTVGSATNAYNDAVATAQDYTDAEIADEIIARDNAIGQSLTTAENYADTAAGNALTSANGYTDDAIGQEVTDRNSAISTAKQEAIDAAASDATNKANAAETNANDYTDAEITALEGRSQSYADTAATNAENAAKAYADGLSSGLNWKQAVNLLYDAAIPVLSGSGATQLVVDGHPVLGDANSGYRLLLTGGSDAGIYVYNSTGGSWTLTRSEDADSASELIGAAVFVMEGTNYASTAWVQADHYLTDFTGQDWTQFSGQGTYLAGNGLVLDGTTFSIDTDVTATKMYADDVADAAETAANSYTDGRETAITTAYQNYADQAETDANGYTDDSIAVEVTDRNNAIDSAINSEVTNRNNAIATAKSEAIGDANDYTDGLIADEITDRNNAIDNAINALDTDDIEEGSTNQYFTDGRAKTSAADLLTGATLTNITISGNGSGLTITAENGVADSTTDDLDEGSVNKYFTDGRVLDAIADADIQPLTVQINNYRKEEATQQYVTSASTVDVHSIGYPYESAKYLVRVVGWVGGVKHSQISEILMTVDGNDNIAITEYGTICTDTNPLASFSARLDQSGSTRYVLTATTAVSGCEVIAAATMLSWAD